MAAGLKKKYELILAREHAIARAIALHAIKPKPFSVWEVLIPVIFILSYIRSRESREIFTQNLLFTKKMALEAALAMVQKEQSKETVMAGVRSQTESLLSSVPTGLYSEAIRREQIKEIDLLIDHYCRLLQVESRDYAALVAGAYPTREDYVTFQQKLKSAEKDVTEAARRTLGAQTDADMLARIEAAAERLRLAEIEKVFSASPSH